MRFSDDALHLLNHNRGFEGPATKMLESLGLLRVFSAFIHKYNAGIAKSWELEDPLGNGKE